MRYVLYFRHILMIAIASLLLPSGAFANDVPQSFTLDGQLFRDVAGTLPLVDSSIGFKVQILDQDQVCVLYEEQQTVNTATSQGYFSAQVGSAVGSPRRTVGDSANAMASVFQNINAVTGKLLSNGAACTAAALAGNRRFVRIVISPPTMGGAERVLSPNLTLDSVPNAVVAERAESIQGFRSGDLLKVNTASGAMLSQTNLESLFSSVSRFNSLTAVVDGTSSSYVQSSAGGARLPVLTGAPTGPTEGAIWYDTTDDRLKYYNGSAPITVGSGSGSVTSVGFTAPAELSVSGAPVTSSGTIAVTWASQTANRVLASPNGSAGAPSFRALVAADVPFAVQNSGGTPSLQSGLDAAKGAAGTAGRVWIATDTRFIYRDTGTVWETIGDGGGGGPTGTAGGDLNGTYPNPTVDGIQGVAISAVAPVDGQVLRYTSTGTQWAPANFSAADLRTAGGAAQFASATCAASQTTTWSSLTNTFTCVDIAGLAASTITSGTIDIARLPAAVQYWTAATGGINYAGGNVGIGTTTPSAKLNVVGGNFSIEREDSWPIAQVRGFGFTPHLVGQYMNGTMASPTYPLGSHVLFLIRAQNQDGGGGSGQIVFSASENQTASARGGKIDFHTTANGSTTSAARMTIENGGNVGIGTVSPNTILDINGAFSMREMAAPALSPADQGRIYFDSTANKFRVSENNGAYVDLVGAGGGGDFTADGAVPMTGNLRLNNNWLSNDGGSEGVRIANDGKVGVGISPDTFSALRVGGQLRADQNIWLAGGSNQQIYTTEDNISIYADTDSNGTGGLVSLGGNGNNPYLIVADSGNVGIGTTSPGALLQIGTAGTSLGTMRLTGNTSGFVQIQPAAAAGSWNMTLPASAGTSGQVLSTNGSGVTSWASVPVTGGTFLAADGTAAAPSYSFNSSGNSDNGMFLPASNELALSTAGVDRVRINSSGNVGIATTAPVVPLSSPLTVYDAGFGGAQISTVNNAWSRTSGVDFLTSSGAAQGGFVGLRGVSSVSPATAGVWLAAHDNSPVLFGTSTGAPTPPSERMRITPAGNIGIGTTSPGALLQIGTAGTSLGTMRLTGNTSGFVQIQPAAAAGSWNMTLPADDGTSGQALITDGSGVTSWSTVPSNGGTFLAAAGSATTPSFSFSGDTNTGIFSPYGDALSFTNNGLETFVIDAASFYSPVARGPNMNRYNGTNLYPTYRFQTDEDTGMYSPSADVIRLTTGGTDRLTIGATGDVGIGTIAPGEKLEVNGSVKATSFISTSDERLKTNIQAIPGLESVLKLNGYQYNWKSNGEADAGVLAQEVEPVFPAAVKTDSRTGYKGVKYQYLIAPLIESIKELYQKLINQDQRFNTTEREIASLKESQRRMMENLTRQQVMIDDLAKSNTKLRDELRAAQEQSRQGR